MEAPESTYDASVRWCWRVIVGCEGHKMRLRAQLVALTVEEIVATVLDPASLAELEQLRKDIEDQIRAYDRLEEHARAVLRWLHRAHGPIRWARAASPERGAEKVHYVGASNEAG